MVNFNEEDYKIKDTDAHKRLLNLFDEGSFSEIDAYAKSGEGAVEVAAGFGSVLGTPVFAFSQDVSVDGGAISKAQCAKIKKLYDLASKTGTPVIGIYDSNGVRLNEGLDTLTEYGELLKLSNTISGVVPQISVIVGACVGTSAMIAAAADIVIVAKDADFYLSAPNKISAEDCLNSGVASLGAASAEEALELAKKVVSILPVNNLSAAPLSDFSEDSSFLSGDCASIKADAASVVKAVSDMNSCIELSEKFGQAVKTTLATVAGNTVGFIAFHGQNIDSDSCDKATRFIRLCDAFSLPVITLVDTEGFDRSEDAQKAGILRQASKLTSAYAEATTVKISLIIGNAIGSSYISLAGHGSNADLVYAWKCAVVSALEPESAVAFLMGDRLAKGENRAALVEEYAAKEASPLNAAALGLIDDVFSPDRTREKLISALDMLAGKRVSTLPKKHSVI